MQAALAEAEVTPAVTVQAELPQLPPLDGEAPAAVTAATTA